MMRRDERGLTLIEVSIVLAIVGILAVTSYGILGNVLSVIRTRGAAEQLATAFRMARQSAITNGERRCLTINLGPPPTYAITGGGASNAVCGTSDVSGLQGTATIGDGDTPLTFAGQPAFVVFDPIGRSYPNPDGSNAEVTFNLDTNPTSCVTSVTVTLYGGVKVQKCA